MYIPFKHVNSNTPLTQREDLQLVRYWKGQIRRFYDEHQAQLMGNLARLQAEVGDQFDLITVFGKNESLGSSRIAAGWGEPLFGVQVTRGMRHMLEQSSEEQGDTKYFFVLRAFCIKVFSEIFFSFNEKDPDDLRQLLTLMLCVATAPKGGSSIEKRSKMRLDLVASALADIRVAVALFPPMQEGATIQSVRALNDMGINADPAMVLNFQNGKNPMAFVVRQMVGWARKELSADQVFPSFRKAVLYMERTGAVFTGYGQDMSAFSRLSKVSLENKTNLGLSIPPKGERSSRPATRKTKTEPALGFLGSTSGALGQSGSAGGAEQSLRAIGGQADVPPERNAGADDVLALQAQIARLQQALANQQLQIEQQQRSVAMPATGVGVNPPLQTQEKSPRDPAKEVKEDPRPEVRFRTPIDDPAVRERISGAAVQEYRNDPRDRDVVIHLEGDEYKLLIKGSVIVIGKNQSE